MNPKSDLLASSQASNHRAAPLVLAIVGNEEDYQLVRRSFEQSQITSRLHRCQTGKQALIYLKQSVGNRDLIPASILLDLNLPDAGSLRILEAIAQTPALSCIPTIILTSADREEEIQRCYLFGANIYLMRIADFANIRFRKSIFAIVKYWVHPVASLEDIDCAAIARS
jgi:two-component system, response regulator